MIELYPAMDEGTMKAIYNSCVKYSNKSISSRCCEEDNYVISKKLFKKLENNVMDGLICNSIFDVTDKL